MERSGEEGRKEEEKKRVENPGEREANGKPEIMESSGDEGKLNEDGKLEIMESSGEDKKINRSSSSTTRNS